MSKYIARILFLLCVVHSVHSQEAISLTGSDAAPRASQTVLRSHYNKTLSSLGPITVVRIDPSDGRSGQAEPPAPRTPALPLHSSVWHIIETAELRDYSSMSVAIGLPPRFSIEYADGTHASVDKYTARVTFPDKSIGIFVLYQHE